jgi:hypothetical protein
MIRFSWHCSSTFEILLAETGEDKTPVTSNHNDQAQYEENRQESPRKSQEEHDHVGINITSPYSYVVFLLSRYER